MRNQPKKQFEQDSAGESSVRDLFIVAVIALLVLFVANFAALRTETNFTFRLLETKWNLLHQLEQPVDCLVLGDSSGNQGIVPSVLKDRLGVHSVANFCTFGDMLAVNDAWMLETYIKRFGAPRRLIVVHVYDIWYRKPLPDIFAYIPFRGTEASTVQPKLVMSMKERLHASLVRYFPLYFERSSIATALTLWNSLHKTDPVIDNEGFMKREQADPTQVEGDAAGHREFVAKEHFHLSTANREAVERMMQLSEQYHFPVYMVNSPLYSELYSDANFQRYYNDKQQVLTEMLARNPMAHAVLTNPMLFPKEQMENADHLTYKGASAYTNRVADEILAIENNGLAKP